MSRLPTNQTGLPIMRRLLLASAFAAAAPLAAHADAIHGVCFSGTTVCVDQHIDGTDITTIASSPGFDGKDFGFAGSGKSITGPFDIVIAVPNNIAPPPTITLSGTIG